jgi:hypothetical protein
MISKTDYILYRECAKDAWLRIHMRDLYYSKQLSAFAEALIETGNEVELVARQLFPDGVLVEGRDDKAQAETKKLVEQRVPTVFQAVFSQDGYFAATDILQRDVASKSFVLSEVKATSEAKEKEHFPDLAFQVNLLRRCGLNISRIQLFHLNSEYVRSGDLNLHELFEIEDVTEPVSAMLEEVAADMEQAKQYLSATDEPAGACTCVYKGRSKHCTMFAYINPDVPEYGIHDIARICVSKKKLEDLVDTGVYLLDDIPEDFQLTDIQRNQVDVHKLGRPLVQQGAIQAEFAKLVFPLYFLDYETYPCAIPRFDGFSPYQQIPFQFSLHVVEAPDSEPLHKEFLYTGSGDPSSEFLAALSSAIGAVGSVLVWNKSFECGINSHLATRIADGRAFLEDVNSRVFDLEEIFTKQLHVHPGFKGKTSIKNVLPVLAPDLSYKVLEIQEGGTASQEWNKIATGDLSAAKKQRIAANLLTYCQLDTYAMFAIWKHLHELA